MCGRPSRRKPTIASASLCLPQRLTSSTCACKIESGSIRQHEEKPRTFHLSRFDRVMQRTLTPRRNPHGVDENVSPALNSKTAHQPWSLSKQDRFAGPGSLYKSDGHTKSASGLKPQDPGATPDKPRLQKFSHATPTSTYRSKTDRFALPGGVYPHNDAPGIGTYDASTNHKVSGVLKIQQAIRKRQSRGIFAQQEALARQVPSPTKYDVAASNMATKCHDASERARLDQQSVFFRDTMQRFGGHGSVYAYSDAPPPGTYTAELPFLAHVSTTDGYSKLTPAYLSTTDRFTLPDGVYAPMSAATPGVGSYDPVHHERIVGHVVMIQKAARGRLSRGIFEQAETHARGVPCPTTYDHAGGYGHSAPIGGKSGEGEESAVGADQKRSAFFKDTMERFGGHGSVYALSDAPAVGTYAPSTTAVASTARAPTSSYLSATDRFTLPGGVHELVYAGQHQTPGVGAYDTQGVRDRVLGGVILLQRAFRARLSRGIFEAEETHARGVPSPTRYFVAGGHVGNGAAGGHGVASGRFTAPTGPHAKSNLLDASANAYTLGPARRVVRPDAMAKLYRSGNARCTGHGGVVVAKKAALNGSEEEEGRAPAPFVDMYADSVRYSEGGTALDVYESFAPSALPGLGANGLGGKEEGADGWLAGYSGALNPSIAEEGDGKSSESSAFSPLTATKPVGAAASDALAPTLETASSASDAPAARKSDESEGCERLFALLVELSAGADVKRSDYFDETNGWDVQGLRSDLKLCQSK